MNTSFNFARYFLIGELENFSESEVLKCSSLQFFDTMRGIMTDTNFAWSPEFSCGERSGDIKEKFSIV